MAMIRGQKITLPKMTTLIPPPYDTPGTAVPHALLSLEFLTGGQELSRWSSLIS